MITICQVAYVYVPYTIEHRENPAMKRLQEVYCALSGNCLEHNPL